MDKMRDEVTKTDMSFFSFCRQFLAQLQVPQILKDAHQLIAVRKLRTFLNAENRILIKL